MFGYYILQKHIAEFYSSLILDHILFKKRQTATKQKNNAKIWNIFVLVNKESKKNSLSKENFFF